MQYNGEEMADKSDNKKKLLDALKVSLGVVSTACDKAGISRDTHYRWLKEDEDYKASVDELTNVALDFVESKLFEQIKGGSVPCIIFYLKTKGKGRGYIEKQEIKIEGAKPATWFDDDKLE